METKNDNDEWNYDLVYVDLNKDCNVYLFTSKEEFLKSEEYMTVLEGICHDWCTFDGINNANTCGSNLVLKVPITTNKSGKLQVFCDIIVYSKKIGVDYSEWEMMI